MTNTFPCPVSLMSHSKNLFITNHLDYVYNTFMQMFWFITIWISNIISTNGFVVQDTFNVLLKDDADYKVDLIITADDYEMIDKKQLNEFKIDNEREKFRELDEMVRMTNHKVSKIKTKNVKQSYEAILPIIVVKGNYNNMMTTYIGALTTISTNNKRSIKKETETEYDYDYLVKEYYDEANNESRSKNAYHIRKSVIELSEYGDGINSLKRIFSLSNGNANCSEVKGIGLLALKCLIDDYNGQRQTLRDVVARLWRIFQIWFLVYLTVAIPLWCTRGWCCCCLCCKFFKPRQTIEEAKRYVVLYPPGIFKTKNGEIRYEPSEREKECYEEFEHFIKTL